MEASPGFFESGVKRRLRITLDWGLVIHSCDYNTWEVEAVGPVSRPSFSTEYEAKLKYISSFQARQSA